MNDWKGNIIKDGDTVVVIRTKPLFSSGAFGFLDFSKTPAEYNEVSKWDAPKHIWSKIAEYKIKAEGERLLATMKTPEGIQWTWVVGPILPFVDRPSEIVCIKDVSDKPCEYFNSIGVSAVDYLPKITPNSEEA